MKLFMRLLREPLFHFIAIGGLIFAFYVAVDDGRETRADLIVITPERIAQLATGFASVWNRMPSATELDHLIEEEVREEVYYREALALGLDQNDIIVRRRLRQKMEFMMDSSARLLDPPKSEIETYFKANELTYRRDPRVALEQIYLGEHPTPDSVSRSLTALESGPDTSPSTLGERTLLPAQLGLSPARAIDNVFGEGFFDLVVDLPLEVWSGPISSTYGVHLVRILDAVPPLTPALEEVRDEVLRDWRQARAQEIREQDYAERRARFVVEIRRDDGRTAADQ